MLSVKPECVGHISSSQQQINAIKEMPRHSPPPPSSVPRVPSASLPHSRKKLAESTRTKEEERMLSPRSYTPPPRTQTLPRSRAARELYFSANSDILIVNRREVSFLCLPSLPSLSPLPSPQPQCNTPHNRPARQGAQDTKHSSPSASGPACCSRWL